MESVSGAGIIGAEVIQEEMGGEQNLAILNGVSLPFGCMTTGQGHCRSDPLVAPASRQHSVYPVQIEMHPGETEIVVANVTDSDALIAFSAFDAVGRYLAGQPSVRGFLVVRAHEVKHVMVNDLFGLDLASFNGYVRIEDPFSVVVGAVVNNDRVTRRFLTVLPLVPDLAQQGQEVTEAFFSRLQIELGNPGVQTGVFILNPNNNTVRFTITVIDSTGMVRTAPAQTVIGRGTFARTRQSLSILFPGLQSGYFEVEVQEDLTPGTGERLTPYVTYRSANYLSAVPPQ
jgi:hypothetical protein